MKQEEYVAPSGGRFVLREQTGDDDEKLNAAHNEVSLVNTYVANVIVEGPGGKAMDSEAVKKLRLGDKYFLVIASRILSLGDKLYFEYEWEIDRPAIEYEEDLNQFIWDYSKEFPEKGHPKYFSQRIRPYPKDEFIELTIGDMKIRMDYLDGHGEDYLMKLPPNNRTVNQELIARNIRFFKGDWKVIKSFASFTARNMIAIRNKAHEMDPAIEGLTSVSNPYSGEQQRLPLLGIKDFFYPVKI